VAESAVQGQGGATFVLRIPPPGMPQIDGYALMRMVRALPAERGGCTPAVAVTASARPEDTARARAVGFQEHAAKPIDPRELAAITARIARRQPSRCVARRAVTSR
jgi:CheY-like chemotaxis protein